tara:strand:+ start:694 stop:1584 length:891 start_codon:yes stop_codon:yes gene_type:complete
MLKHKKFLKNIISYYEPYYNYKNYRNVIIAHEEKLGIRENNYELWISSLIKFFKNKYLIEKPKILDFGSGTGEFVVWMNKIGADAKGIEMHEKLHSLSKTLAIDNNLSDEIFVLNKKKKLPFKDNEFDFVTLFSVLEHIDDENFDWIFDEIKRVCKYCIYVLVPNPIKPLDDHTGLAFINYFPRELVLIYLKLRSKKHSYFLSDSGEWDVFYRFLPKIKKQFKKKKLTLEYPPEEIFFPPTSKCPPIDKIGKQYHLFGKNIFLGVSFFRNFFVKKLGVDKYFFYPYLNFYMNVKND